MRSVRIELKRAYERPSRSDGQRFLVERLWPRGATKDALRLDGWFKEVAPSPELRKWYGHDPARWTEFRRRYLAELESNQAAVDELVKAIGRGPATFVYAARDEARNSALVLRDYLQGRASG